MSESANQKRILDWSKLSTMLQLWRNNVGAAKLGRRWVRFGLCKGSSDLIGFTEVRITPGMVGKTVAVFTACEVKKDEQAKTSPEQDDFGAKVEKAGGIFVVATTPDAVHLSIKKYRSRMMRKGK